MRKKGFTLIELLVALLLLVSGLMTVSFVSSASLTSYKSNQLKIENINYADTIINFFKASGKLYVKGNFVSNSSCNLYFNNLDELDACLKAYSTNHSTVDSSIDSAKLFNVDGKANGAYVKIEDKSIIDSDANKNVNMYSVLIKVWNLKNNNSNEAKFKIYIGR